jgi:integrase
MLFNTLGRDVGIVENPFKNIKPQKLRQVQREIFSPGQISILFEKSTGWMRQLIITAFCTFQREKDCCLIKKSYIKFDLNRVEFPFTSKTGQAVSLPLMPIFRELAIEAIEKNTESEYLFPELANLCLTNQTKIGKDVKKFFIENGINGSLLEVPGYSRQVSVLDIHSIRHTSAVIAVMMGWPLPMVMQATGHRSLCMLMRYIDHISEEQKEKYFAQFQKGLPNANEPLPEPEDPRKRLIKLAETLPLQEIERLLSLAQHGDKSLRISLPKSHLQIENVIGDSF